MSTQNSAQWFNPTSDRLEAGGSGIIPSRLSSAQRLALSLTTADAGLTNYDVDAKCVWQWNGSAWVDPVNQRIDVRAYGAKGDASNNDTAAVVLAIAAAAASRQIVYFPPGYTFLLNSRTGPGTSDLISVPSGVRFQIDGTLTGSTGQTVSFVAVGDFQAFGTGFINIGQGVDNRFFQVQKGFVRFSGLRFAGFATTSTPACIVCIDPGSGTLDNLIIENCHAEAYVQYLYLRQQSSGSTHSITRTRISDCIARGIYNGSAILINAVSGLDRDVETLRQRDRHRQWGLKRTGVLRFRNRRRRIGHAAYAITSAVTRVMIHGVLMNSVREGIHIEYCARVALEDITITDVNATYYPQGTASGGVIVYGSYDPTIKNVVVTDVTGDGIYAWGIRVSGGYAGAVYAQSNKNIERVQLPPAERQLHHRAAGAVLDLQRTARLRTHEQLGAALYLGIPPDLRGRPDQRRGHNQRARQHAGVPARDQPSERGVLRPQRERRHAHSLRFKTVTPAFWWAMW
jgi:hypothetical protein